MRRKLFSKVIAMIAVCSAIIGLVACGNAEPGQQGKESTGVKEEGKKSKNPETSEENQKNGNVVSYHCFILMEKY